MFKVASFVATSPGCKKMQKMYVGLFCGSIYNNKSVTFAAAVFGPFCAKRKRRYLDNESYNRAETWYSGLPLCALELRRE